MWESFLDRETQSCSVLGKKASFAKQKLNINSVEYQSYMHKNVLSCLDNYPSARPSIPSISRSARTSVKQIKMRNNCSPNNSNTKQESKDKYSPVYLKLDSAFDKSSGINHCNDIRSKSIKSKRSIKLKTDGDTEGCECRLQSNDNSMTLKKHDTIPALYKPVPTNCHCSRKSKSKVTPKQKTEVIQVITSKEDKNSLLENDKETIINKLKDERLPVLRLRKNPPKDCEKSVMINDKISVKNIERRKIDYIFGKIRLFEFGERGSNTRSRGEPQDFYRLRDECLDRGTLFEDPEFPATDSSLFFSQRPDRYYEWKRPHEICDDPQFFVEGYSRFDVQQGELGDCWLLAAAANLTLYHRLFLQIVPDDQGFDDKYSGVFHFRFWQYGKWVDVVIDDRLPTYQGQLVFLHSTEENEFWSALLEKAYAKLHGSYEALKGGSTCEAMEDFTGGVTEMYEMEASPPNLFQIMIKAYERASLMGCSIEPDPNVLEAETPEGLIRGHAYSITRVQYVDIQTPNVTGKIPLLRLRNPWGNESEWNGSWSDGSAEWRFISESEKEELGLTFDNDGEFWMSFKDFQVHFSRLEICNLNPDSLSDEELKEGNKKKWEMSVFEGEWVRGVTAGGCRNFLESFWHNPQYRVTLSEVDEGDDEGNCTVIVGLMQKNRRQARHQGGDLLTVGFALYHLPYPDRVPKPLDENFFKYNASVARSPSFINLREVSCRFKLPPGTYCIVPSTFDPNEEGEFLLRVFSEHPNNMEYDGEPLPDHSFSRRAREVEDDDEDEAPRYRPPSPPSSHGGDHPSAPYGGYPSPGASNPYPGGGGYPYPQSGGYPQPYGGQPPQPSYGGYNQPYPQPGYGGYPPPNQYPGYPGYQPQPQPSRPKPKDPISNFFNNLENDQEIGYGELDSKNIEPSKSKKDSEKQDDKKKNKKGNGKREEVATLVPSDEETTETDTVYEHFLKLAGEDKEVDWLELKKILDNFIKADLTGNTGFSKDICRSMIAMLDVNKSGKLGYEEFTNLWTSFRNWKNVWSLYDRDGSGTLSTFELRKAMNSAGYNLNSRILNVLMHRYGNKIGEIAFDDFMLCAIKVKTMIDDSVPSTSTNTQPNPGGWRRRIFRN